MQKWMIALGIAILLCAGSSTYAQTAEPDDPPLPDGNVFPDAKTSGATGIVVFVNDGTTMDQTDVLDVRTVLAPTCYGQKAAGSIEASGLSYGQIFAQTTKGFPQKKRTILRIELRFDHSPQTCGFLWFWYTDEKEETP